MQNLADEELIAAWQTSSSSSSKDERYVNELFRRHHERVALWCYRFAGDRDSARDLAQEVFLKAYRNLGSFQGSSKFSTWLYSITRNVCLNELDSRSRRPESVGEQLPDELPSAFADPLEQLRRTRTQGFVRQLLEENLSPVEISVMTMHYAQDMPLDAIGRLLELDNASGAKAYLVSARRKLNRVLERWRARDHDPRP